jgi:hypothetical protein
MSEQEVTEFRHLQIGDKFVIDGQPSQVFEKIREVRKSCCSYKNAKAVGPGYTQGMKPLTKVIKQ